MTKMCTGFPMTQILSLSPPKSLLEVEDCWPLTSPLFWLEEVPCLRYSAGGESLDPYPLLVPPTGICSLIGIHRIFWTRLLDLEGHGTLGMDYLVRLRHWLVPLLESLVLL